MSLFEPKMAKNQGITSKCPTGEAGSILLWILVAVALFGALSYTMSKGNRAGVSNVGKEQASLAVSEMLENAQAIRRVVQQLQINGCDETEISFENTTTSGYTNPNAPTDESCHVFRPNGGGMRYTAPDTTWLDTSQSAGANYGEWRFVGHTQVEGVGSSEPELRMATGFLKESVCLAINDKIGVQNPSGAPPVDGNTVSGAGPFIGTYDSPVADSIGDDGGHDLAGRTVFCREGNNGFQFNQVLIAR
jgi:hypothetical protein